MSQTKFPKTETGNYENFCKEWKKLYEENLTPGEYSYQLLQQGKKQLPDFYRSDLQAEFDKIKRKISDMQTETKRRQNSFFREKSGS